MKWNTNEIIEDLKLLVDKTVTIETEVNPQGEHYVRDIFLKDKRIKSDGISIVGFRDDAENLSSVDTPEQDIPCVEIRTFLSDSEGGLPKKASKEVRDLYYKVVDYFNKKEIEIIDNLKDMF